MTISQKVTPTVRKETILRWYQEAFPLAASHIRRKGGNLEEAKEVFQESVLICYEKLVVDNFQPDVNDLAYLMGIVRNRWLKHQASKTYTTCLDGIDLVEEQPEKPDTHKLLRYLQHSGKQCLKLLQSFYYEKLSMKQLAHRFGYASERSATVQKYKCLEKIRNEVKTQKLNYEDFLNRN